MKKKKFERVKFYLQIQKKIQIVLRLVDFFQINSIYNALKPKLCSQ